MVWLLGMGTSTVPVEAIMLAVYNRMVECFYGCIVCGLFENFAIKDDGGVYGFLCVK